MKEAQYYVMSNLCMNKIYINEISSLPRNCWYARDTNYVEFPLDLVVNRIRNLVGHVPSDEIRVLFLSSPMADSPETTT